MIKKLSYFIFFSDLIFSLSSQAANEFEKYEQVKLPPKYENLHVVNNNHYGNTTYNISATSFDELADQLLANAPTNGRDIKSISLLQLSLDWNIKDQQTENYCDLVGIDLNSEINFTYPTWDSANSSELSDENAEIWFTFLEAIFSYQDQNKKIINKHIDRLEKELQNVKPTKLCTELQAQINALGNETIDRINQEINALQYETQNGNIIKNFSYPSFQPQEEFSKASSASTVVLKDPEPSNKVVVLKDPNPKKSDSNENNESKAKDSSEPISKPVVKKEIYQTNDQNLVLVRKGDKNKEPQIKVVEKPTVQNTSSSKKALENTKTVTEQTAEKAKVTVDHKQAATVDKIKSTAEKVDNNTEKAKSTIEKPKTATNNQATTEKSKSTVDKNKPSSEPSKASVDNKTTAEKATNEISKVKTSVEKGTEKAKVAVDNASSKAKENVEKAKTTAQKSTDNVKATVQKSQSSKVNNE